MIVVFFFNDTATTEIYTLSLHDALPISQAGGLARDEVLEGVGEAVACGEHGLSVLAAQRQVDVAGIALSLIELGDRKSTRLNSSHANISYAVFCLEKKNTHLALSIDNVA